ncbi:Transposable element Tcb2 transposase [Anthophora retusa]
MCKMGRKARETIVTERKIILHLFNEGHSYSSIANIVNRSRFTIRSIIKRFSNIENFVSAVRCGRPEKLSVREKRKIVNIVKEKPTSSASEIAAYINENFNKEVHKITIRRILNKAGYRSRVARRKPTISKINQEKRLKFANDYITKENDFWSTVLFSDESKFNIFQNDGRTLVWRRSNTELDPKNVQNTVKHGGGGVMVWGCMSSSGVGELVFIDNIMDKYVYLDILKNNVRKSVEKLNLGRQFVFQQDNDPKHTAYLVRQWIVFNTPHLLPTPPQSPDLNPIEHLWAHLGKCIKKHNITNRQQLKEILTMEWNKISPEITKKLVHSMSDRLRAVINNKGLHTKY